MKTYELKIIAEWIGYKKEVVDKETGESKLVDDSFLGFRSFDNKGNKCTIRFNDSCSTSGVPVPTKEGTYIIKVKSTKIYPDNRKAYSVYRIKEIEDVIAYDDYVEEIENDDLPF